MNKTSQLLCRQNATLMWRQLANAYVETTFLCVVNLIVGYKDCVYSSQYVLMSKLSNPISTIPGSSLPQFRSRGHSILGSRLGLDTAARKYFGSKYLSVDKLQPSPAWSCLMSVDILTIPSQPNLMYNNTDNSLSSF